MRPQHNFSFLDTSVDLNSAFQVAALLFTHLFLVLFVMDMSAFGDCSCNRT